MSTNQRRVCGNCGKTTGPLQFSVVTGAYLCNPGPRAGREAIEKAIKECNARRAARFGPDDD